MAVKHIPAHQPVSVIADGSRDGGAAVEAVKMTSLTQADLESFAKLGIPPELLELAGIVRVTDREARETYGISGGGDMSGIAFPYFDPETMSNGRRRVYVRIRRDHPELENGKPKKKYVAPWGDRKRLYFPPTPELFADVTVPIVLVESEKSALALTALAARTGRKILPIAMGGCFGWIGKTGVKETPTGERVPEMGAIRDLNICRECRSASVLLDANCASNPKVLAARSQLVRRLRKQGADTHTLDLPAEEGVNGPDDFIGLNGDEAMLAVLEESTSGAAILDGVSKFIRRYVHLSDQQAKIVAVWTAHTHAVGSATTTPYLAINSAIKQSGKTRLLEVLELLVAKPWLTGRVTAACLTRKVDEVQPTLLLDESDAAFGGEKEYAEALRGILNTGFYEGGVASCCVGQGANISYKDFKTFCAKAFAGIGNSLPETVFDRSIPIRLERKKAGEVVARFRKRKAKAEAEATRVALTKWMTSILESLKHVEPELPEELTDRQQDGLEPLAGIADAAGHEWPVALREAAVAVFRSQAAEDPNLSVVLLEDIRSIFDAIAEEKITTTALLDKLKEIETSPWADWNKGKGLTPNGLSRLLKPFGVSPRTIRVEGKTPKGYLLDSLSDAWERYLPPVVVAAPSQQGLPAATPPQTNIHAGETHFSETQQEASVAGSKTEQSPVSMRVVAAVADEKGGETPGGGGQRNKDCQASLWTEVII